MNGLHQSIVIPQYLSKNGTYIESDIIKNNRNNIGEQFHSCANAFPYLLLLILWKSRAYNFHLPVIVFLFFIFELKIGKRNITITTTTMYITASMLQHQQKTQHQISIILQVMIKRDTFPFGYKIQLFNK